MRTERLLTDESPRRERWLCQGDLCLFPATPPSLFRGRDSGGCVTPSLGFDSERRFLPRGGKSSGKGRSRRRTCGSFRRDSALSTILDLYAGPSLPFLPGFGRLSTFILKRSL